MKYARNARILVNGRQWLARETRELSRPVGNVLIDGSKCCRNPSFGGNVEQLDELSVVGFPEEPEVGTIFETSGKY